MKKLLLCIGTRADAIKMAPLCRSLDNNPAFETCILSSGQHREMCRDALGFFSVEPDIDLDIMKDGQDPEYVLSELSRLMPRILEAEAPDAVLVHGDTATALGCARAAHEKNIRVAHVEAGLRSGDERSPYPEELFRREISRIASFHFAPVESARENLLAEGVQADRIFVTGNTVIDALLCAMEREDKASALVRDFAKSSEEHPLVLLTLHRRENHGDRAEKLFLAVDKLLADNDKLSVLFPMHKSRNVREAFSRTAPHSERFIVCEPLDYPSFVYAMGKCRFIISDSGGVVEEASFLSKPTVYARDHSERKEAETKGPAILCGADGDSLYRTATRLLEDSEFYATVSERKFVYGDGKACERISKALESIV